MQFNVAQLLKETIGAKRRYEIEEDISNLDPELMPVSLLEGTVQLLRTHSGILVTADLQVALEVNCSRCLEPVERPLHVHFEESFRPLTEVNTGRFIPPQEFKGSEEELTDPALLIDDHHILDLSEIIRQNIWLALPMYPGCIWSEPELCPNFAKRLEEMEEVHQDLTTEGEGADEVGDIDPRWAALLALRDQSEED